jgi:uncharacterized membrane protein
MDSVDLKQGKAISYIVAFVTILTGLVGVLAYLEAKKHSKINDEVLHLDKQIKMLELALKTNEAKENGVA